MADTTRFVEITDMEKPPGGGSRCKCLSLLADNARIAFGSAILIAVIAAYIGVVSSTATPSSATPTTTEFLYSPLDSFNSAEDPITISIRLKTVEPSPAGAQITATMSIDFPLSLLTPSRPVYRPSIDTTFFIGDASALSFKANTTIPEQTVVFRSDSGSVTNYPFDVYKLEFSLLAVTYNATNSKVVNEDDEDLEELAFLLKFDTTQIGNFVPSVEVVLDSPKAFTIPLVKLQIQRSKSSKIYPMFVIVGMLFVMVAMVLFCSVILIFRFRKADNPTMMTFFSSLIFALPALRNSMPNAPPIGSNVDIWVFFWAESFAITLLVSTAIQYWLDAPRPGVGGAAAAVKPPAAIQ